MKFAIEKKMIPTPAFHLGGGVRNRWCDKPADARLYATEQGALDTITFYGFGSDVVVMQVSSGGGK